MLEKPFVLQIWDALGESEPDGYAARAVGEGPIQVLDENGTVVGYVGERVELGGGVVGASYDTQAFQQTPEGCGDHYWLVAPS